jgi:hypothetical protein
MCGFDFSHKLKLNLKDSLEKDTKRHFDVLVGGALFIQLLLEKRQVAYDRSPYNNRCWLSSLLRGSGADRLYYQRREIGYGDWCHSIFLCLLRE